MSLRPLTVLVTACGSPGTAALLRALRANGEREIRLVGTDMSERAIGAQLCDAFHLVAAGEDPAFADDLLAVAQRERVDVVIPQSSFDLQGLADRRDDFGSIRVLVSAPRTIRVSNDKAVCYDELQKLGVPVPRRRLVRGGRGVEAAASSSGTRTAPSASSLWSRPVRVATACSTPLWTGRDNCSTSVPDRFPCGSKRRWRSCLPRLGRSSW